MSTESETDGPAPGMIECPVCANRRPRRSLTAACAATTLTEHRAKGPEWLRLQGLQRIAR